MKRTEVLRAKIIFYTIITLTFAVIVSKGF